MSSESIERTPAVRLASVLLAIEAVAVVILAGWQVVELVASEPASIATSIALVVMTLVAAFALFAFARGVWDGRSWGRSGGIVAQVLIFAVALGSVQGGAGHWGIAALLAAPAVLTFVVLIFASRPAGPGSSQR
ncbi:MAG: histidine kinase [Microbacterium gubbeenense]|uniref:histidine kinase n=1 Tax=Microbacterium gubbeenense TaxID=159896 RepID=UPI003F9BAFB9